MRVTIIPRVTIEFTQDTIIRGAHGVVDEHCRGTRLEAYVDKQCWRVPQDGGKEDYFVYPTHARQVPAETQAIEERCESTHGSTRASFERPR